MASAPQMKELSLGQRLKLARDAAGFTQTALAERVGRSRESYSDYERDIVDPPASVLRMVAEVCNVSADWLLFGATRVKRDRERPRLGVVEGEGAGSAHRQLPLVVSVPDP